MRSQLNLPVGALPWMSGLLLVVGSSSVACNESGPEAPSAQLTRSDTSPSGSKANFLEPKESRVEHRSKRTTRPTEINWAETLGDALKRSEEGDKPIFVFQYVHENGDPDNDV